MTILLKMAWPNTVRTLHKLAKAAESCAENMGKKTIFGKDKFHKPHVYFLYELELTIQAMMEDGRVNYMLKPAIKILCLQTSSASMRGPPSSL